MHSTLELIAIWAVLFALHLLYPSYDLNWSIFAALSGLRLALYHRESANVVPKRISAAIGLMTVLTVIEAIFR